MNGESAAGKIEHRNVRVILNPEKAAQAPPDVKQEGKLIDWAEALRENAMLIAAAGVLASEGSLEKAASVLEWAGFGVPAGYFPEGHEGYDYFPNDEEALRLWVEGEAERIEGVIGTAGFHLAATGTLMDEVEPPGLQGAGGGIEAGDLILKPGVPEALGIGPEDLVRAVLEAGGHGGAAMAVPDARTGEPVPIPLREMNEDDSRRLLEALKREREGAGRMEKLAGDLASRMREHGCGPGVTAREFLEGGS